MVSFVSPTHNGNIAAFAGSYSVLTKNAKLSFYAIQLGSFTKFKSYGKAATSSRVRSNGFLQMLKYIPYFLVCIVDALS